MPLFRQTINGISKQNSCDGIHLQLSALCYPYPFAQTQKQWVLDTEKRLPRMKLSHLCLFPVRRPRWLLSFPQKISRWGSGPIKWLSPLPPALHTQAALYVRTFSQGELLEQLGHGISRVDLHSQLCPCKRMGGDILSQMLPAKGAMSHDRCLNNKTQLVLSFLLNIQFLFKEMKNKIQAGSFQTSARWNQNTLICLFQWGQL